MDVQFQGCLAAGMLAVGFALYVAHSYWKVGSAGMARHYRLDPDERVTKMWLGELDARITLGEKMTTAALGLVSGAIMGSVGVATVRALGATALLTTKRRLVLVVEQPHSRRVIRHVFHSPGELALHIRGPGRKRMQGGPSVRVEVALPNAPCTPLLFRDSIVSELRAWARACA